MKTLILMRHAHRDDSENHDPDLSKKGKEQAESRSYDIRAHIGSKPFKVVSSPYKRCQQTAEAVAKRLNTTVATSNAVREHPLEAPPLDPTDNKDKLLADLREFLDSLEGDTIVVSHLRTIKEIIGLIRGTYPRDMQVPHASIHVLEV